MRVCCFQHRLRKRRTGHYCDSKCLSPRFDSGYLLWRSGIRKSAATRYPKRVCCYSCSGHLLWRSGIRKSTAIVDAIRVRFHSDSRHILRRAGIWQSGATTHPNPLYSYPTTVYLLRGRRLWKSTGRADTGYLSIIFCNANFSDRIILFQAKLKWFFQPSV
jgi:hypothetical protein